MTASAECRRAAAIGIVLMCGMGVHPLFVNATDRQLRAPEPGAELPRQIKHLPHLAANHTNGERYVVTGVCQARGMHQIVEILQSAAHEEMWAFLPRAHGSGACQWHEIGREEKSANDGAYVRVDMAYLESLMARNSEIQLFHFHPLQYFECAAAAGCPKETARGPTGSIDKRWITDLLFSMPSPSDVHFMMDVTSRFHKHHQGQGTIRHQVVTPYGVVDYGLTAAGLVKFEYEMHSRSEGRYITWVMASRMADDSLERVIQENPGGITATVRRLAQTLNTEFLRVEYSPF